MQQPKLKVLVVDDNPTDRLIVRSVLGALHIKDVQEAEGGMIAEAKVWTAAKINEPYDLIILDWNMPKGNGQRLIQTIKSHPLTRKTKLIVMTATADRKVVEGAIEEGADDFIVKPIELEVLKSKLEKIR